MCRFTSRIGSQWRFIFFMVAIRQFVLRRMFKSDCNTGINHNLHSNRYNCRLQQHINGNCVG